MLLKIAQILNRIVNIDRINVLIDRRHYFINQPKLIASSHPIDIKSIS